ncbi:MAG: hypothetical protein ACYDA6_01770 [Solirubrobacteraceae bacterium]
MRPARYLGCTACRIRLRATAPEVALLDGLCPICNATLEPAASVGEVLGFRPFELEGTLDGDGVSATPPAASGGLIDLGAHRKSPSALDGLDAQRWQDEGGRFHREAAAEFPARR